VGVVVVFFAFSKILAPYTIVDTSEPVLRDEAYFFNNVKEKFVKTVNITLQRVACPPTTTLEENLETYVNFTYDAAAKKGFRLAINYTVDETTCDVYANITLSSREIMMNTTFVVLAS
jgi:hypothetical protein